MQAITGAFGIVVLVGGVRSRDLLQIAIGLGGLGLAVMMFIWGKPPPTNGG